MVNVANLGGSSISGESSQSSSESKPNTALKSKRVYHILREEILTGSLQPGKRLGAGALATRLETSQVPVREALLMLTQDGLVEMKDFVGARVRVYSPREIQESLFVRGHLEGIATQMATAYFDEKLEARLERNIERMDEVADTDDRAYAKRNRAFHDAIFEYCPNSMLREMIRVQSAAQVAFQSAFRLNATWARQSLREHREILNLMRAGDADAVAILATEHKLHLANALVSAIPHVLDIDDPQLDEPSWPSKS